MGSHSLPGKVEGKFVILQNGLTTFCTFVVGVYTEKKYELTVDLDSILFTGLIILFNFAFGACAVAVWATDC